MQTLRQDAQAIIDKALADALPDSAVRRALEMCGKNIPLSVSVISTDGRLLADGR